MNKSELIKNWEDWIDGINSGNQEQFKQGLMSGLNPVKAPPNPYSTYSSRYSNWTGLAEAIVFNQFAIAQEIIHWCQSHAPYHIKNWLYFSEDRQRSYLHLAACYQNAELVPLLVNEGLDIDYECNGGWPPVWLCIENSLENQQNSSFQEKVQTTFSAFVKAGSNIAKRNKSGWSMGEYLYHCSSFEMFRFVLENFYQKSWEKDLQIILKSKPIDNNPFQEKWYYLESFFVEKIRKQLNKAIPETQKINASLASKLRI